VYTHLHGECQGVDDDEDEDAVLETTRRDEPPDLVLKPHAWNVAPLWLHLQRELDTLPLYTQTHGPTQPCIPPGSPQLPDLVLESDARNIASLWLHLQRELDTLPLQTQTTKKTHAYIQNEPFFMSNFVVFYASAVHPVGR